MKKFITKSYISKTVSAEIIREVPAFRQLKYKLENMSYKRIFGYEKSLLFEDWIVSGEEDIPENVPVTILSKKTYSGFVFVIYEPFPKYIIYGISKISNLLQK